MRLLTARNLLVLLLAGMLNAASSASGENSAEQSVSARPDLSSDELALIELTNAERKRAGLALLIPDPALMRMAREHSRSMATPLTHARYLLQWYGSAILIEGTNREGFLIKKLHNDLHL